jgi:hypothetical protein
MKKSKFTESQIAKALKEYEGGHFGPSTPLRDLSAQGPSLLGALLFLDTRYPLLNTHY